MKKLLGERRTNGTASLCLTYTNGYFQEGSVQMEALEWFVWGTIVALTPIFLGLSVMLWRDIDENGAENRS